MSADRAYEVHYSESALESLQEIDTSLQPVVNRVLLELGTNLDKYPDRIDRNRNKQLVYCHPSPQVEITYTLDKKRGIVNCLHVVAPLPPRLIAFVSYSHKDRAFLEKVFKPFMVSLVEQRLLDFWHDEKIEAGTDWEESIQNALRSAKVAVLLVTQDFLYSEYIRKKELPVLEEGHKAGKVRVYWIPVETATYKQFWFARLQALCCDPEKPLMELRVPLRQKQLTKISEELQRQLISS